MEYLMKVLKQLSAAVGRHSPSIIGARGQRPFTRESSTTPAFQWPCISTSWETLYNLVS